MLAATPRILHHPTDDTHTNDVPQTGGLFLFGGVLMFFDRSLYVHIHLPIHIQNTQYN